MPHLLQLQPILTIYIQKLARNPKHTHTLMQATQYMDLPEHQLCTRWQQGAGQLPFLSAIKAVKAG